jgi:hypothetical protein
MGQLLMMTAAEHHIGLCPVGGLDFLAVPSNGSRKDLDSSSPSSGKVYLPNPNRSSGFALGENHVLLHSFLCGHVDPNTATGWSFLPTETEKATGGASHAVTTNLSADQVPPVTSTTLHHFLKEKLPEALLPSAIVILENLPLNPNGKADRKHLPRPDTQSQRKETEYREPTSEIERTVAAVWQEVLPAKKVGIYDNFFDLGGNSLLMVRAYSKLRKVLSDWRDSGSPLSNNSDLSIIEMFFQYPNIHTLAEFLAQGTGEPIQSSRSDAPGQQRRVERSNVSLQQERSTRLRHRSPSVGASPAPSERNQEDA